MGILKSNGVRQGCPLSPLLSVPDMNRKHKEIRKDKVMSGVKIAGGGEVKCVLYLDDVNIVV